MLLRIGLVALQAIIVLGGCRSPAKPEGSKSAPTLSPSSAAPLPSSSSDGHTGSSGAAPVTSAGPSTTPGGAALAPALVSKLNPEGKWQGPARLVEQIREQDFGRTPRGTPLPNGSIAATPLQTVCGERSPCRQIADHDAGRDPAQRRLQVLGISLAATSKPPPVPSDECEPVEYWLVVSDQDQVASAELLLHICNDGYGAAGVGEDDIVVEDNHFTHGQSGGSAWRWYDRLTLQLFPRRVAATSAGSFWSPGFSRGDIEWDWRSFRGHESEAVPPCTSEGSPPDDWDDSFESKWLAIPAVAVPAAFATTGWKQARLGRCAAPVTGGEGQGFVTHGAHDGAADATMRVVALHDASLLVEIQDDRFVFDASRRLYEDHVELWAVSGEGPSSGEFCYDKDLRKPVQWGIRLKDGSVFPGFGAPAADALHAESVVRDGSVMLKLTPQTTYEYLTVVYSDSDDGKAQESLIATSRLRHGVARSLGDLHYIHPASARCELVAGSLEPILE